LAKIKTIIVDDEELARENLEMLLNDYCPEIVVIAKAGSVKEAYEKIVDLKPELVFLDIRMPSGTEGFDLLAKFDDPDFMVIFATAFKDYAIEAMNANAIHYILKPIDISDLESAVSKVVKLKSEIKDSPNLESEYRASLKAVYENLSTAKYPKITINHSKGIKLIDPTKIIYLEAKSNCSTIYLSDGSTFLDTRTLGIYENLLPDQLFFRVHRSFIINMDYLEEYRRDRGKYVILNEPISLINEGGRSHLKIVKTLYIVHLKGKLADYET